MQDLRKGAWAKVKIEKKESSYVGPPPPPPPPLPSRPRRAFVTISLSTSLLCRLHASEVFFSISKACSISSLVSRIVGRTSDPPSPATSLSCRACSIIEAKLDLASERDCNAEERDREKEEFSDRATDEKEATSGDCDIIKLRADASL